VSNIEHTGSFFNTKLRGVRANFTEEMCHALPPSPTVLCVDDRPQVLELRKATLESHHYCVKIASNSYSAIKILEETPAMVAVLVEYKTEGVDAEAVAYRIKLRFPDLPIILLSVTCPHSPHG
jgi:CheY-like chemotaxis protein